MTARQLAKKLGIYPHAIYRSIETLQEAGCVTQIPGYPLKFQAIPPSQSVERFSLLSREAFLAIFQDGRRVEPEQMRISFLKDRDALLQKYAQDAGRAIQEMDLIISGHELPAEVHYENMKAIERGVKLRVIVQNLDNTNRAMIKRWQEAGLDVRYSGFADIRLVVIDRKLVHLLSYSKQAELSGMGVTLAYAPFAEMMMQVFEAKWGAAQLVA